MKKEKKIYEKPELEAIKMNEIGAATCCRNTTGVCTGPIRNAQGKEKASKTAS